MAAARGDCPTKVCELHRDVILPLDHPWWATHRPPIHWGCLCTLEPMTAADAAGRVTTPEELAAIPTVAPDFGDGLTPDTRPPAVP